MLLLLALSACAPDVEDTGPVDARAEPPAEKANTLRFVSGEEVIPARSEKQLCTFFTWTDDDVAIHVTRGYQNGLYGHHAVLLTTLVSEYAEPDGSTMDCTSADDLSMAQTEALYVPSPIEPGSTGMTLPEGMAIRLPKGTRLVLQSHTINWSDEDVVVNDVVDLETMPIEDVTTWAAAFAHTTLDIAIPPGETFEKKVECTWEDEVDLLLLVGHMHEHGKSFSVDHFTESGSERIYDVPAWRESYRDNPPVTELASGEIHVRPGDRFETTCQWENDTSETLTFPAEMCAAVGIAYPATDPLYCAEL